MYSKDMHDASSFGLLRSVLAKRGCTQAWITEQLSAVDDSPSLFTRGEVADILREAMFGSPKAGD